ncbi:response regulator [Labrys monachus]|uniref:CheY-like chemotaxis protein n=1 Tax=Labrys monachus TaxID=217067 RepID=A0ABU0FMA8_9HYPH|nr:response regulator [Labrys monachus]MDQ0395726.1 CheY-like chemotaxis protein [Labrys monachus]
MALILVADDEFLLADMLANFLRDEGHEVVTAAHGVIALQMIRERRPALVITDFMMPLMTGLELAQAVKADAALDGLPVILVSGAQGSTGREHGELFAEVFDKPYDLQAMLAAINGLLSAG